MPNTVHMHNFSPVEISCINNGIKNIKNNTSATDPSSQNSHLEPIINEKKVYLKKDGILSVLSILDILMIEAEGNYSKIILVDGRTIMTSKTLKYWFDTIGGTSMIRVHRSYFVNKNHVISINLNEKLLMLSNGISISLSRRNFKNKVDSIINI